MTTNQLDLLKAYSIFSQKNIFLKFLSTDSHENSEDNEIKKDYSTRSKSIEANLKMNRKQKVPFKWG
jgi:hypothetical protein